MQILSKTTNIPCCDYPPLDPLTDTIFHEQKQSPKGVL